MSFSHTYLLEAGLWEMTGLVEAAGGRKMPQEGQVVISHTEEIWSIDGQITIISETPQVINNRYEITPFKTGADFTEWKSHVGGPEPLYGLFVIVDDAIMSPWQSASGEYWGQEVMVKVSADEYRARGFSFLKRDKVSSWSARFIRLT